MIQKIALCGHTGSINRGCEAIVRSTATIMDKIGVNGKVDAFTFDEQYDRAVKLDEVVNVIPYGSRNIFERINSMIRRKIFKDSVWAYRYYHRDYLSRGNDNKLILNVGGDTYCCSEPYLYYALNEQAQEKNIPTVFWGCSVDDRALSDAAMQKDINRYSYIVVRESYSEKILKRIVSEPQKIIKACDPAFQLPTKEVSLPNDFKAKNTLGINLSPLVFRDTQDQNDLMYQNIYCLIDWILANTDMHVCLIPHVFHVEDMSQDLKVLSIIKRHYANDSRISIVVQEYSCSELKYIISNCRFFIGARTHSMIAAYSSEVPALALSYSIKSRGLAYDLFGNEVEYAISWKAMSSPNDILDMFIGSLLEKEKKIKKHYAEFMPAYKETIIEVANRIVGEKT